MKLEKRFYEVTQSGRTVTGNLVTYNKVYRQGDYTETFLSGCSGDLTDSDLICTLHHKRDRIVARSGGGLEVTDTPESLTAVVNLDPTLPDGKNAIDLLERKLIRGLSVEFYSVDAGFSERHREVRKAELVGFSLVDRPALDDAVPSLRFQQERRRGVYLWL